jgi:putative resolvase
MTKHLSLSKASKILGITTQTLRAWDREGKIHTIRTEGGHRRVPQSEIDRLLGKDPDKERILTLAYCRCSTNKQVENLERQVGRVLEYCSKRKWQVELFKDIGSGLNDNRKGFQKLIKKVSDPAVKRVIVEYSDRLTRFGFETFKTYCGNLGVEIVVIEKSEKKEFEQELTDDLVALIASYSGRLYGRRGGRKKKKNG